MFKHISNLRYARSDPDASQSVTPNAVGTVDGDTAQQSADITSTPADARTPLSIFGFPSSASSGPDSTQSAPTSPGNSRHKRSTAQLNQPQRQECPGSLSKLAGSSVDSKPEEPLVVQSQSTTHGVLPHQEYLANRAIEQKILESEQTDPDSPCVVEYILRKIPHLTKNDQTVIFKVIKAEIYPFWTEKMSRSTNSISDLHGNVRGIKDQLSNLNNEYADFKEESQEIKTQLRDMKTDYTDFKRKDQENKIDVADMIATAKDISTACTSLNANITTMKVDLANLESVVLGLKADLNDLKKQKASDSHMSVELANTTS